MVKLEIGHELKDKCPDLYIGVICCRVENSSFHEGLWEEIHRLTDTLSPLPIKEVNKDMKIAATRQAYKNCGKDPNRYRPAAEALRRRIIRGLGLYRINTLVDLVNLVSLKTGYSIGGFDLGKVEGPVRWGIGNDGEPYMGIGRGSLNIEGLPVLRDRKGGIGTPTSDEERTKLDEETSSFYMNINGYGGVEGVQEAIDYSVELLEQFVGATEIETGVFH